MTFAWQGEILTVKDKEAEREAPCTGGRAVGFWQPFIPQHTHNKCTPLPGCSTVIYTHKHTRFFGFITYYYHRWSKKKKSTILPVTLMLPWVHISLQKPDGWVTAGPSSYLVYQLVRMLDCFSVSLLAHSNHNLCVITVCQLAYNTCMSANLSACSPLCLCASPHSQASLAVWAAFCHLAEGWSAGVILWRHEECCLSLGVHAGDSTNKTVAWRHLVIYSTNR